MKKKLFSVLMVMVALTLVTSCSKKFEFHEVGSNEWGILVPYEGDTAQQAQLDSLAFFEKNLVSGKRITIPYSLVPMGDGSNQNMPTAHLLKVSRDPITRLWYNEVKDGKEVVGDKKGFATETKSSVGITVGITLSMRVIQPAKWFFWKREGADLTKFIDNEVYATVASTLSSIAASYDEAQLIASKVAIAKAIQDKVNEVYSQFGLECYTLGLYGGIIFDNPAIQVEIDNRLIMQNKKIAAEAEVEAEKARVALIPLKAQWAEIAVREATAAYIRAAAEKGIPLVPQVQTGSGSGVIVDLTTKK